MILNNFRHVVVKKFFKCDSKLRDYYNGLISDPNLILSVLNLLLFFQKKLVLNFITVWLEYREMLNFKPAF